ncbi:MAG: LemA family protein [Gammaproteobacteria bacterium]|nr:MAG: LemA family protein [Gammaproteobacteria bacterium]
MTSIVIIAIIVAVLIWGILVYNSLVYDRNTSFAAWSDIDVQLKRRHDLIPKLVEAIKQYADYESSLLQSVTELRSQAKSIENISDRENVERELQSQVHKLIAVVEDYPELKANQNFLELQKDISDVENNIQYARRYYNGAVRNINTRIDSFPDLIIARFFKYKYHEYFQLDD